MSRRWTASQMDRIMQCPASATLPVATEDAPAAERGTEIHAHLLDAERCPEKIWLWLIDGYEMDTVVSSNFGNACLDSMGFEVTFAWSPVTRKGRVIGVNLGRNYGDATEDEIPGTADAVAFWLTTDGWVVRIGDLKTGAAQVKRGTLPPAKDSWQLRELALAITWHLLSPACRSETFPAASSKIASCKVAHFLYDDNGEISTDDDRLRIDEAEHTADDLNRYADQIAAVWQETAASPGQRYHRGPGCRYCPSFDFCPAQQSALQSLFRRTMYHPGIAANAADAWEDLKAAERIVERAKETLRTVVLRAGKVPTRPGYELTTTTRQVRRIDAEKTIVAIDNAFCIGPDSIGADFTKRVATQETVAEGVSRHLNTFTVDDVMAILESEGAVTIAETEPFLVEKRTRTKEVP